MTTASGLWGKINSKINCKFPVDPRVSPEVYDLQNTGTFNAYEELKKYAETLGTTTSNTTQNAHNAQMLAQYGSGSVNAPGGISGTIGYVDEHIDEFKKLTTALALILTTEFGPDKTRRIMKKLGIKFSSQDVASLEKVFEDDDKSEDLQKVINETARDLKI